MTHTRKQWAATVQRSGMLALQILASASVKDTYWNQPDVCVLMDLSCWIHQSPSISVCRTYILPTGDIFSIVPA